MGSHGINTRYTKMTDAAHRNFAYMTPRISAPTFVHHGAPLLFEVKVKLLHVKLLASKIGLLPSK